MRHPCAIALLALAITISVEARGQSTGGLRPGRLDVPVRDGGVLHLATGTWTRHPASSALGSGTSAVGPGVIYNSTSVGSTPIVGGLPPSVGFTDEGRIPSPTGPSDHGFNRPGCATSYAVNGFRIGYATQNTSQDCDVSFIESYSLCTNPGSYTPLASFHLSNLPASSTQGVFAAWIVTIDLSGPPDSSFGIAADGDGAYEPGSGLGGVLDRFGWTMRFSGPGAGDAGPLLVGQCYPHLVQGPDRNGFDGTLWDPVQAADETGIGMSTTDAFWIDGLACLQFTYGASYLRLYTSTTCPDRPGSGFCFGDGSGTACPCGASPVGFGEGCISHRLSPSEVTSAWLRAEGVASLSADSLVLHATGLPQNTSALLFQGTQRIHGGSGSLFGEGLRCAGGSVRRLGTKTVSGAGRAAFPDSGDPPISLAGQIAGPGLRTYQAWFRVAQDFCTPATFNLTNGWEVQWMP